jgi:dienelactone hydrolase
LEKNAVKAKILVLNGAADPLVPFAERQKFIEDMQASGADLQFVEYGGALHAFTNPDADKFHDSGLRAVKYDATAEQRSMALLRQFFDEIFK